MNTFGDAFQRLLDEAQTHIAEQLGEHSGVEVHHDDTPLTAKQHTAWIPLSTEVAMDAGLMTDEQARARGWTPREPVRVPWRRRARWRWQAWRERAGRKVGGWIAGVDLSEREDDY